MWIQTYKGNLLHFMDPNPEEIDIEDIAHALSLTCRYSGHCSEFYSVAQHSFSISKIVRPELALAGLLHDASEAYISDLPRPIKRMIPEYKAFEEKLLANIFKRFGLDYPMSPEIKRADTIMLATEQPVLMGNVIEPWDLGEQPLKNYRIYPLAPQSAERQFLDRYYEILDEDMKRIRSDMKENKLERSV